MDRRKFLKVLGIGAAAPVLAKWLVEPELVAKVFNKPIYGLARRQTFWVDSGSGNDGATGACNDPFATVGNALDNCRAGEGDFIFIRANHTETFRKLPEWPSYRA